MEHLRVPILQVNNASVQGAAVDDLRDISRERLERTFNTNVIAMFNLVQVLWLHTHGVICRHWSRDRWCKRAACTQPTQTSSCCCGSGSSGGSLATGEAAAHCCVAR